MSWRTRSIRPAAVVLLLGIAVAALSLSLAAVRPGPAAAEEGPVEADRGKNFLATREHSPDEDRALLNLLVDTVEADRYPLSPRIRGAARHPDEVRRGGAGSSRN